MTQHAIEFYFDDSGSHDESDVVVWGGVVGYSPLVSELIEAWQRQLSKPAEGKSSIEYFSSRDLLAGNGQFEGYEIGARDRVRRNFRQIIVEAGLTVLSYGVSTKAWAEHSTSETREAIGSAERFILGTAIKGGASAAIKEGVPVTFCLDEGALIRPGLNSILNLAIEAAGIPDELVSFRAASVKATAALQAADLVAHETYRYFLQYNKDECAEPNAHLRALLDKAHDARAGWLGENELRPGFEKVSEQLRLLNAGNAASR